MRLLQDYDRHAEICSPAVARSTLLARDGQQFRLSLRFHTKKVIAVTLDSEHDAVFIAPAGGRASSRIRSTRIVEVNDAKGAAQGRTVGNCPARAAHEARDGRSRYTARSCAVYFFSS
ncbi:MAG: hypothetical protein JJE40_06965 [Vicinamibacteria bacterium]|nr:hypothetical protein [Vicinamibacteria bacterium]